MESDYTPSPSTSTPSSGISDSNTDRVSHPISNAQSTVIELVSDDDYDDDEVEEIVMTAARNIANPRNTNTTTTREPSINIEDYDDTADDIQITSANRVRRNVVFGLQEAQRENRQRISNDNEDDDVQITDEREIPQQEGYTLFLPGGPQFRPHSNVRVRGIAERIHGGSERGTPLPPPTEDPPRRLRRSRRITRNRSHAHTHAFGPLFIPGNGHRHSHTHAGFAMQPWRIPEFYRLHFPDGEEYDPHAMFHRILDIAELRELFVNGFDDDEIPRDIMDRIRLSEEATENRRVDARAAYADRIKETQKAGGQLDADESDFTNGISDVDDSLCILCGVVLSEGLPGDYKYQEISHEESKKLITEQGFKAPYQLSRKITSIDTELSKKIFFGRCGHVYCGRCVNNMLRSFNLSPDKSFKKRVRRKKYDLKNLTGSDLEAIDFDDLMHLEGRVCVHDGCNKRITKLFFRQLFI